MSTLPGTAFLLDLIWDKDDCHNAELCVELLGECMCNSERNSNSGGKDLQYGCSRRMAFPYIKWILMHNLITSHLQIYIINNPVQPSTCDICL